MGEFGIGQGVPRFEDPRLVRGEGRYVGDIALPGMAFGHVLRSPHAHARIRAIDVSRAKGAPGVLAVLTGAAWQASGFADLPGPGGFQRRDGSPLYRPPFPALVKDPTRWVADYVASVGAETVHQARSAAERIAAVLRGELSKFVLRVPESKVRGVAGDIGGSVGMRAAVYNEVGLVLLAAKLAGRPVKWISSRSEAFLGDAQARDNVTDAELALDRDGNFLALRVKTIANLGAYLQVGGQSFITNIGTLAGGD